MRAYGYIRVSTGRQALSERAQRTAISAYCDLRNLELAHVYADTVSGGTRLRDRPEGAEMLAKLGVHGGAVVAVRLDRLFRNVADCCSQVRQWADQGVGLHLLDHGGSSIDTSTSAGRLFLDMLAAFASFERELIGERTASALADKRARGEYTGGQPPYGYKAVNGVLQKCQDEQAIIDEVHRLRDDGLSLQRCADVLNGSGKRSRTGRLWDRQTVHRCCL